MVLHIYRSFMLFYNRHVHLQFIYVILGIFCVSQKYREKSVNINRKKNHKITFVFTVYMKEVNEIN